ncbi:MAG: hypothetical protein EOM88_00870 [Clostridia bacterium]|nr:hypothetical protein [Clostridia bacterium]
MDKIKNYQLQVQNLKLLRDAGSVRFHVDNNDYFATIATVLKLLEKNLSEAIKNIPKAEKRLIKKTFKNLETDLMILQNNYQIKIIQNKGKTEAKGKLRSQ